MNLLVKDPFSSFMKRRNLIWLSVRLYFLWKEYMVSLRYFR